MGFFPTVILNPSQVISDIIPQSTFIGDVEIDVLSIEEKVLEWERTLRPIAEGMNRTDARKRQPNFIRIDGWLTDVEFSPIGAASSILSGAGFQLTTWEDKKRRLEGYAASNEPIQITTRRNVLQNMQIDLLAETADKDSGGAYHFRLEASEFKTVSTGVATVDPSQIPKELADTETAEQGAAAAATKPPKNKGKVAPVEAKDADLDPLRVFGF
jgi:hypothetical protein